MEILILLIVSMNSQVLHSQLRPMSLMMEEDEKVRPLKSIQRQL